MSTIKTGTTLTTAYQVEGDTTGALVIQTGATPTTAVTIGADQSTTLAGTLNVNGPTQFAGTGASFPSSGTGIEIVGASSGSTNYIQAYNRTASSWQAMQIGASTIALVTNGSTRVAIDSGGTTTFTGQINADNVITSTNAWSATSGGSAFSFGNVGLYLIYGQNAAFTIFWRDLVLCNIYAGATVIASNGYTGGGSLPTRTYTASPYLGVSLTGTAGTYTGHYVIIS